MKKFIILFLVYGLMNLAGAQEGAVLDAKLGEQIVQIPKKENLVIINLEATIFKPKGMGPFPLVIINHGKSKDARSQKRARYLIAARALVRRGFVVLLPMREGFANSQGNFSDGKCDFVSNGKIQAADVRASIDYAKSLPYVDASKIVIFGQSHGGLTTMALGMESIPGVLGLVNFAGGYRKPACLQWEDRLVKAFAVYGKFARYPSLWFYGDNDSFWSPELRDKMFQAYNQTSGGKARLVMFGSFQKDAHTMFVHPQGVSIWLPQIENFFTSLGLDFSIKPDDDKN